MDSGRHVKELECVSTYDEIRLKWAERVIGISTLAMEGVATASQQDETSSSTTAREVSSMGWALKTTSKRPQIGDNVKQYRKVQRWRE